MQKVNLDILHSTQNINSKWITTLKVNPKLLNSWKKMQKKRPMALYLAVISQIRFPKHDHSFSLFRLLQTTTGCRSYTTSFLSQLCRLEASRSGCSVVRQESFTKLHISHDPHMMGKDCRAQGISFLRALNPFIRLHPHFLITLSKALRPLISSGFRFLTYEFWGRYKYPDCSIHKRKIINQTSLFKNICFFKRYYLENEKDKPWTWRKYLHIIYLIKNSQNS